MNWQPIETAPKDGTRILLDLGNFVVIGKWKQKASFERIEYGPGWQIFDCEDPWYSWAEQEAQAWMPLPEPPR